MVILSGLISLTPCNNNFAPTMNSKLTWEKKICLKVEQIVYRIF